MKKKALIPLFYLYAQSCEVDEVDFDLLKLRPQIVQQNFQSGVESLRLLLKGTEVVYPIFKRHLREQPNPCRLKQNSCVQGANKKIIQV